MPTRKDAQKKPDRLAEVARTISRKRLEKTLLKNRMVTMRVSETDHEGFKRVASHLGLTVTDYLVRLHRVAAERLKGPSKRRDTKG